MYCIFYKRGNKAAQLPQPLEQTLTYHRIQYAWEGIPSHVSQVFIPEGIVSLTILLILVNCDVADVEVVGILERVRIPDVFSKAVRGIYRLRCGISGK